MEDHNHNDDTVVLDTLQRPSTPSLPTPTGSKTPPTISSRRSLANGESSANIQRQTMEPEQNSIMQKLSEMGRQRERTPGRSPSRKRQRTGVGDRFIPNREGQDLHASYNLLHDDGSPATPSRSRKKTPHGELHFQRTEEANRTYSKVLRNELMGDSIPQDNRSLSPDQLFGSRYTPPAQGAAALPPASRTPNTPHSNKNMFQYGSPNRKIGSGHPTPSSRGIKHPGLMNLDARSNLYSVSPINYSSQNILQTPRKQPRPIPKVPFKVLDAPELADDFYLNLVDWGSANILGSRTRLMRLYVEFRLWQSHPTMQTPRQRPRHFRRLDPTRLTSCSRHTQRLRTNLRRRKGSAPPNHDWPQRPRRRTRLERPHSHLRLTRPAHIPP